MANCKNHVLAFVLTVSCLQLTAQNVGRQLMQDFPEWVDEIFYHTHPDARVVENGLFTHTAPITEQYSEVRKWFAGTREGMLYVRAEGTDPTEIIAQPEKDHYWTMDNAMWSPNGQYLAVKQVNDTEVPEIQLKKSDSDEIIRRKYSRAGEALPGHTFYVVNADTGDTSKLAMDADFPYIHLLQWSSDNKKLYLLVADRLMKQVYLQSVDINTGIITTILEESADTYLIGLNLLQGYSNRLIESKQVVFFEEQKLFSWMSERSGFNQIYLYDQAGNLIRPLTNFLENGTVQSIETVDSINGWMYFTSHANADEPYELSLFRTSIVDPRIEQLTTSTGMLDAFFRKSMDTLWIFRSELPQTLQLERYLSHDELVDVPWQANKSVFEENKLNYEYEWVMAADGITRIPAFILKPVDFNPEKRYPVVEHIYGPSFNNVVVRDLLDDWLWSMNRLAQAGYIVVFLDGRGTSGRGKEFKDFSYGNFGLMELDDHVEGLKQLGAKRPYMDMNRVGVLGHSWGGHFALRAVLDAPELYKAAHLNAGTLDPVQFRVAIEPFMGCLPADCPENYKRAAVSIKLKDLKAPIMIAHGTYDDDVPIEDAYTLVRFLNEMNYPNYEFVPYEGMDHILMRHRDWHPAMIDFFNRHLK